MALSSVVEGRESPAVVDVLASMPANAALWWQVWQLVTAVATVV